jgi:pimeloyl-ACP methyl ester carboxylesterase
MEDPLFFTSDDFRLFGVLHLPEGAARRMGVLFCPAFAEEHKQGYRVFVELARRLAAAGFPCLRFEYRGTGDSEGPFTAFSLAGALRDIGAAASFLRERAGVSRLVLVGLRLGASLAWRAAEEGLATDRLVLWQPIVDGGLFYRLNIRRMLVRQMMTEGKARGERDTGDEATIDLDGYLTKRATCEEIKALDLRAVERLPAPALLVQFAHSAEVQAELAPLVAKVAPPGRFLPLVLEPFWNRLGYVDCSPAVEATVAWLVEQDSSLA